MNAAELRCLDVVRDFNAAHGRGPTYQEIADALGHHSKGNAYGVVARLVAAGLVEARGRRGGVLLVDHVHLTTVSTERLQAELRRREALPR